MDMEGVKEEHNKKSIQSLAPSATGIRNFFLSHASVRKFYSLNAPYPLFWKTKHTYGFIDWVFLQTPKNKETLLHLTASQERCQIVSWMW